MRCNECVGMGVYSRDKDTIITNVSVKALNIHAIDLPCFTFSLDLVLMTLTSTQVADEANSRGMSLFGRRLMHCSYI